MKASKKIFSLLLALVMVLGLSTGAFASEESPTITIKNTVVDQTYSIYKVFDLTYAGTNVTYTYTKSSTGTDEFYTALTSADSPFTLENTGSNVYTVSQKEGKGETDIAAFLKEQVEEGYLGDATETKIATGDTVTFEGLDLGYYYIADTLGTAVGLDSTTPDAEVYEKNPSPDVTKQVKEDSTGSSGDTNTADIGDKIEYTTTIKAKAGAENYVLHDTMTSGLTFNNDIVVTAGGTTLVLNTDYTVTAGNKDGCTFEISFAQDYLDKISAATDIVVTYTATVNSGAVIDGAGNTNKTHLSYGENSDLETGEKTTTTKVFDVEFFKYVKVDGKETALPGAKFEVYKMVDGEKQYAIVQADHLTGWTTDEDEATVWPTYASGKFKIIGLDADTYYLKETVAPDGYNKLTEDVTFIIDTNGNVTDEDGNVWEDGLVKVENKSGTELPSTGGIGTTIFYVVGSILVIGAAVLLITKKRMNGAAD